MGYFSTSHKYAPGLGGAMEGEMKKILRQWRRAGIGVVRERKK
ncbi:hypothetical protein Wildcat_94 [Mycobacterium phage Wildcat]|uniref:Uncharacterized protein n=4 Tax=Mycobacterium virus Wildcat TaxID=1993859 RepID=Q19XW6_9CAUD|nr:hypothetical protein Wildcat_94 [Mycobacterium phage Wildcat]AJD82164.1 hypothetical protein COSMO_92 [Mycobacterium phage Cosmo]AQT25763.1 hypothetical protein EniyanLRS_89 [Mycobacterium phage EniyanLRS]QGJ89981.1 hypothetical protein PBI_MARYV_94 [Mycobacterium phage MaryV]WKR36102.1 hypothetical protein [Mycobacterium phage Azrael100]ABE67699.1 hypothetical protein Wildcat_94 [Mycobacterium phage Wildcat]